MKSIQKITRVHLKTNHKFDSILLGIVSAEPDYKLSLSLNNKIRISLKNMSPVIIVDEKGTELTFSRFADLNGTSGITYDLISNRSGKNFLLKKLKNIDYLFQLHDPDNEMNISQLSANIRELDTITGVFNIDLNIIKDKNLQYLIQ